MSSGSAAEFFIRHEKASGEHSSRGYRGGGWQRAWEWRSHPGPIDFRTRNSAMEENAVEGNRSITVFQGTCGWTGQQLGVWEKEGRRPSSSDTKNPLRLYAQFWRAVEVNSSNYAMPAVDTVETWCKQVPSEFRFTFKAFSLFTHRQVDPKVLPAEVRMLLTETQRAQKNVHWSELSSSALNLVWDTFNESLVTAYRHSTAKLGVVAMFQFQLSFTPTARNLRHVLECRRRLDYRIAMAVEFRDRAWFVGDAKRQLNLLQQLRDRGIAIVHADELQHETFPSKTTPSGETTSQDQSVHKVLPVCMDVTSTEFAYCRIHRRTGFEARRLSQDEIDRWRERISVIASELDKDGIIFLFWGTEHRNEPLNNGKNLENALATLPHVEVAKPKGDGRIGKGDVSIERFFPFMGVRKS